MDYLAFSKIIAFPFDAKDLSLTLFRNLKSKDIIKILFNSMLRLNQQMLARPSRKFQLSLISLVLQRAGLFSTAVVKKDADRLDANGEPRFLEQVKLFYESGAAKTGIDPQWLALIRAC